MNVLSVFDGMACGLVALKKLRLPIENYFALEIDKSAIHIAMKNHPEIIQLGNVENFVATMPVEGVPSIDLLIGGSPCQGFSFAGKQLAFEDPRSRLFFAFVEILKEVKPKYFLLENVKMKKEFQDIISHYLGVEPIQINSSLVSAQNRKRLYWTNIPNITQPQDKNILLSEVLESGVGDRDKSYCLDANYWKGTTLESYLTKSRRQIVFTEKRTTEAKTLRRLYQKAGRDYSPRRMKELVAREDNKANCLTSTLSREHIVLDEQSKFRKLTPIECERLQTLPDNYTKGVSNTQRYKMLGNGWTVDVIAHIFAHIPQAAIYG